MLQVINWWIRWKSEREEGLKRKEVGYKGVGAGGRTLQNNLIFQIPHFINEEVAGKWDKVTVKQRTCPWRIKSYLTSSVHEKQSEKWRRFSLLKLHLEPESSSCAKLIGSSNYSGISPISTNSCALQTQPLSVQERKGRILGPWGYLDSI